VVCGLTARHSRIRDLEAVGAPAGGIQREHDPPVVRPARAALAGASGGRKHDPTRCPVKGNVKVAPVAPAPV
jgi:hypothetical protein